MTNSTGNPQATAQAEPPSATAPGSPPAPGASKFYPTFFLGVFLGVFGVHRFYLRKVGTGLLQLFTFGGLGIWWLVDMVMILLGKFRDKEGTLIPNINPKVSWTVFVVVVVIGLAGSQGSHESSSPSGSASHATSSSGWGSALEKRLVGVYECPNPMWALQLKYGGDYAMEALQSGNSFRGTWTASRSSGILNGTYPSKASMTFSIQSDGAIVVDKYGYTFVRTR